MSRIAFIKLPSTYANWYKRPVLGISYLSAYLEQNGYETGIFDALFHNWTEHELIDKLVAYRPDIIGITAMTHEIVQAASLAKALKERLDKPVVVGGPHITALPARTLEEFPVFDYGVYGEGEKTTLELVGMLSGAGGGIELRAIQGLVFRDNGTIVVNEPRPWLTSEELEALPYPAFHHYYGDNPKALADKNDYYVMASTRGCPYHCAFCMQVLGNKVRNFSNEKICDEIEYAITRYDAHMVDFTDEIFLFNNQRTRDFLNLFIERGLHKKITWSGLTRANMVTSEIIALAKKAGCCRLEMGVESGDDGVLKNINKMITIEQITNAVRIIKEHNIPLGTYYILGHPNETKATAQKTIDFAARLNTTTIAIGIMVPYPGTDIYVRAKEGRDGYRILSEDWSNYDKYGGKALELRNLTYSELVSLQKRGYLKFYVRNFRIKDLVNFFWIRRHALMYFVLRKMHLK